MKNLRRIVDYTTFKASINKSKRSKLVKSVDQIRRERTDRLPEREIQVMPLHGWEEGTPKKSDVGEIRAIVKIQDVVLIISDNITGGAEEYHYTLVDEDIVDFIGATSTQPQPAQIVKKDGTPFAGFNGGRKSRILTDEEQDKIREMRKAGHNVNAIARELHISNRVIAAFVKKEKDNG